MNCNDWEERLARYAGGDAPPAETAEVERHLGECAGCQLFASGLKEALEFAKEAHLEPLAQADFTAVRARVLAELEAECRPFWRKLWVYGLVAAGLLLVVLAGRLGPRPVVPAIPTIASRHTPAVLEEAPRPADEGVRSRPGDLPHSRRQRARRRVETGEPVLIRLVSDNPDVVIYWIADTRGD